MNLALAVLERVLAVALVPWWIGTATGALTTGTALYGPPW